MGAVIVADESRRDELVEWRTTQGAIPGVMEAYLALRGLRTLPVRFARQQRTAAELAERLDDHRHVSDLNDAGRHPWGDGGLPRPAWTSHASGSIRSPTANGG